MPSNVSAVRVQDIIKNLVISVSKMKRGGTKMTNLSDFLKRVKNEDTRKMLVFRDLDGGWSNVNVEVKEHEIEITLDTNEIFSSDK